MTAWVKKGTKEVVGIITDFTDNACVSHGPLEYRTILTAPFSSLTELNKKLVTEYLDIPYVETKCGYACSDQ